MNDYSRADLVYKILIRSEWTTAIANGHFDGTSVDLRDGYIHLSMADQLAATAAKHFKDRDGLVLLAISTARLGPALRWEPSRGGALFPHLYEPLPVAAVTWAKPLACGRNGIPILPPEFQQC